MHLFARFGVPTGSFAALADPEGTEPSKLDLLVATKGRDNALQYHLNDLVRLLPGNVGGISHRLHKISFGHRHVAVLLAPPQSTRLPSIFLIFVIALSRGCYFSLFLGLPLVGTAAVSVCLHLDFRRFRLVLFGWGFGGDFDGFGIGSRRFFFGFDWSLFLGGILLILYRRIRGDLYFLFEFRIFGRRFFFFRRSLASISSRLSSSGAA
jgi:hypothetical protein